MLGDREIWKNMYRSAILIFFALFFAHSLPAQSVDGLRVAWDRSSESKIAPHGNYARVIRLEDGAFLAAYEHGGSICLSASEDLMSWSSPRPVVSGFHGKADGKDYHVHTANPELCLTEEGTLLLAFNYRPSGLAYFPFSIAVCRSTDNAVTWSSPDVVYSAGTDFSNGCWEPAFLQLPDSTIHLYFANEGPYTRSKEQEISVLVSADDGKTWSGASTVSFRRGHRDGMPVPALLGDEIVVAIEDDADGKFKPYTVRTSLDSPWKERVGGYSPYRKKALADSVPERIYMGAPYLAVLPGGETLLSYQTTEDRHESWELSCMEVAVSDSGAVGFTRRTRPFYVPADRSGKWNSLFVLDSNTVVAVSSTDKDGVVAPYVVKGHLIRNGVIAPGTENDNTFFIGSSTCDNLTAGVGYEHGCVVLRTDIKDSDLFPEDGLTFLLDITGNDNPSLQEGVFRITASRSGDLYVYEGRKGIWKRRLSSGVKLEVSDTAEGYHVRLVFNHGKYGFSCLQDYIRVCLIHENVSSGVSSSSGISCSEPLVHSAPAIPATWHKLLLPASD